MNMYGLLGYFNTTVWNDLIRPEPSGAEWKPIYAAHETDIDPVAQIVDDSFRVQLLDILNDTKTYTLESLESESPYRGPFHIKKPYQECQVNAIIKLVEDRLNKLYEITGATQTNRFWDDHIADVRGEQ